MSKKIAIIGGGNLGAAIAEGLIQSEFSRPVEISITRRNLSPLSRFAEQGSMVHSDNKKAVKTAEIIILAVKPYNFADIRHYDPRRQRKLLLHRKEIAELAGQLSGKNTTIVPVSMYDRNNSIKVEVAIGKGKKQFDKRAAIKKRDMDKKIRQELGSVRH